MAVRFNKSTYRSWRQPVVDICFLARNARLIARVRKKRLVLPAFRERLMLAVTAVYRCRYCSWAHTREALRSGVSGAEITDLLHGSVGNCPQQEVIALLYAQHWAESDANPDPASAQTLAETYGSEKAEAINVVLRMIRVGNLMGNSWDYLLYKISSGKWKTRTEA